MTKLPQVQWAQREDRVLITFAVVDAKDVNVKFESEQVHFTCCADGTSYAVKINLLNAIDPEKSSFKVHGSKIACCAFKVNATGEIWDRLTKEPSKAVRHYVSVDWSLWKDPDEEKGMNNMDFDMSQFGNFGGGGDYPDSDDEEEPPADLDDLDEPTNNDEGVGSGTAEGTAN